MLEDASTPVVVLDCFRHGGLAIVRSLGRLGVPVHVVHPDRWAPGLFSKYRHGGFWWDIRIASAQESLLFLKNVHARIGRRSLLIATSDVAAMFIADQAERLSQWFVFPERDQALIRSLCSKREMYYLAKSHGVPVPFTAFPKSTSDALDYIKTTRFPVLLKPIYGTLAGRVVPRMELVQTKHELLERYDALEDPVLPNLMLQEYVAGGDEVTWTFNGYFDRRGECSVGFTGRKLRNFPAYLGQASLGICTGNDDVARTTIRFMKAIGYRGPLDLGYRFDARDGLYKVFDINPRVGAMFRTFVGANGMDVVRACYQDLTAQPDVPAGNQEGRKWIVEDCDWISSIRYLRDGKLKLRGWRDSLKGVEEMSYLASDDLWPLAGAVANNIRAVMKRLRLKRQASGLAQDVKARISP